MSRQRQASVGSVVQSNLWFVCCFNLNRAVTVCFLDCRCSWVSDPMCPTHIGVRLDSIRQIRGELERAH